MEAAVVDCKQFYHPPEVCSADFAAFRSCTCQFNIELQIAVNMSSPLVEVIEGKLKGCTRKNYLGEEILAFLGVPFARPPIGKLRFKAPEPPLPWKGVRDCQDDSRACIQRDLLEGMKLKGSEDCLYLNIFTKSVEPNGLKPVLVFLYGGAFIGGSNETRIYGPEYLLMEDIVLVTANYRLGILGYLQLDDPSLGIPGNAGLKDQTMALRWIRKNIDRFGGDPHNVTLGGASAGSLSVHFHMLSPLSRGLFHRAVLQSGTALNTWAVTKNNIIDILKNADVNVENEREALDHLNKLSAKEIYDLQEKYLMAAGSDSIVFGPVIEKPNPTALITEQPEQIVRSGNYNKVPMLLGYCNREGLLVLFNKAVKKYSKGKNAEPEKERSLEEILAVLTQLSPDCDTFKNLHQKIMEIYFANDDPEGLIVLLSDLLFIIKIVTCAELHAETSSTPVYLYRFSLDGDLNFLKKYAKLTSPGAGHCDDLGYIFKAAEAPWPEKDSIEEMTMKTTVKLIANFLRTGHPTPGDNDLGIEWKPVEKGAVNFLDIGETITPGCNPEEDRLKFWREFERQSQVDS